MRTEPTTPLAAALARAEAAEAREKELQKHLSAALGYMLNAHIDLATGAAKKTAMDTLDGGIARIRAALGDTQ